MTRDRARLRVPCVTACLRLGAARSWRMAERYRTFREFYPFYLTEHVNPVSRRLHVIGTSLVVGCLIAAFAYMDWRWLIAAPVIGYGFAWVGHFFFEKNRPATFEYPGFSLMGDFRLWWEVVTLQRKF